MDITEEMITAAYTTYCTSLNFAENKREAMKMALESVLVLMEKEALKQLTEKEDELFHKRLAGNLNMCQKCKGIGPENKLHECLSQQEKEAIERANEAFRNHLFRTNMLLLTSNYMKEQN